MKLLADTVESGFFDTFCAAIAQVKMCGSIFPVVEKITGDHGLISYFIHLHEIPKANMTYSTGDEINIIICDHDFLTRIVQFCKSPKFPFVGFLFSHRIGNLNIVLLITLIRHEINFLRTTVIYLEMIAHIEEFVINDILEVVGEIVTIIHDADGV
ncbi:hypothetical protein GCWU000341_02347 [Oribacterium sp. oral taxon 078 str. F0262]|nr:hypothetical protein GCWU000341_02347 [Oribacterium sp. oral taxon 078 str. F0262]